MSQPYIVKNGNEALTSHGGLALIGALLNNRTKLKARLNNVTLSGCISPIISHSDIVFSMTGLISLAKPDYDAIEPFREDDFLKTAFLLMRVHPALRCVSDSTLLVDFIIKRNLRRESVEKWLEVAKENGQAHTPRSGKTVYLGSVYRQLPDIMVLPSKIIQS